MIEDQKQPRGDAATNEDPSPSPEDSDPRGAGIKVPEAADSAGSEKDSKADSDRKRGEPSEAKPSKLTKKEILTLLTEKNETILELTEKSEALEAKNKELKDKWLRSAAEFENYRKRTRKEWELLQQQTKADVILEILGVVDDFERAFSVVGEQDDEFVQGIRLIYNNLMSSLEKLGINRIEALDTPFDPNYHMAVAQIEQEGAEQNHVVEVIEHGYLLGNAVVRPAKVVIAK
ncbi:MAG: nucleotide exchange factor GrpE [Candidatus Latescibacterota bacterium]|nr:MAG: nucleotide exchange factor GrpE [Candidatus Latescibacterota bacterium]